MSKENLLQTADEQVERLRSAHFADSYEFVAGAVLSDLLEKSHIVALSGNLEMYVRFLDQLNAAKTSSESHPLIADVMSHILSQKFSPNEIKAVRSSYEVKDYNDSQWELIKKILLSYGTKSEEEIDVAIQAKKQEDVERKKTELARFPHIEKVWNELCISIPELQKVSLGVLPAEESPLETARYERSVSKPKILLPFNWRLTIQLIRTICPFQVNAIATTLNCKTEEVTDELILLQQFVHEVGHAVFQLLHSKEAGAAALERMAVNADGFNYDALKKLTNADAIAFVNEYQQKEYRQLKDEIVAEDFATEYFRAHRDALIG